jgi:hypothetical protein
MAVDLRFDPWEFAVRLPALLVTGLSETDIRWLVAHGLAEPARELVRPRSRRRTFRRMANLALTDDTCFVLTPAGAGLLKSSAGHGIGFTPRWDGERRELWYGNQLVKVFRQPAGCQEIVLAAFQEDGWPPRIDDPLPPAADIDPRERLHDTVRRLNRAQRSRLLVFQRDGTRLGVTWAADVDVSGTMDDDFPRPTVIIDAKPTRSLAG